MYIQDLILEITRDCNMNCWFCLRGEPEKVKMCSALFPSIFEGITGIGCLTITGGEPTLYPQFFKDLELYMKHSGITIRVFYIKTNGLIRCTTLVEFSDFLAGYITDEALHPMLEISLDNDRDGIPPDTYDWWRKQMETRPYIGFDDKRGAIYNHIAEGRAEEFYDPDPPRDTRLTPQEWLNFNSRRTTYSRLKDVEWTLENDTDSCEDARLEGWAYVNAKGGVTFYCDFSYESQEKYLLGSVKENTLKSILLNPDTAVKVNQFKQEAELLYQASGVGNNILSHVTTECEVMQMFEPLPIQFFTQYD